MTAPSHTRSHRSILFQSWSGETDSEKKKWLLLGALVGATALNDTVMLEEWMPLCQQHLKQVKVDEAILQTLLFAGYPKTIEALKVSRKYFPAPKTKTQPRDHYQQGLETSKTVYGKYHPRLLEIMDGLHPDLSRLMVENGYGQVLSRPGLTLQDRELCVLVALMATGMINQFRAHIRGTLFAGVSQVDIIWFTNTFECIIAAELRETFKEVTRQVMLKHGKSDGER